MVYLVPRHPLPSSRIKFWFPPLEAADFRFHFLLCERTNFPVTGDHGAAGGVRSPPRAAGGLGFPCRGKPAALGPWTLQFLYGISGARPPPGNAGQGCKRTPGEAERRAQRNRGSAWKRPTGGDTGRGPSCSPGEPRPGSQPGKRPRGSPGLTFWELGSADWGKERWGGAPGKPTALSCAFSITHKSGSLSQGATI